MKITFSSPVSLVAAPPPVPSIDVPAVSISLDTGAVIFGIGALPGSSVQLTLPPATLQDLQGAIRTALGTQLGVTAT